MDSTSISDMIKHLLSCLSKDHQSSVNITKQVRIDSTYQQPDDEVIVLLINT